MLKERGMNMPTSLGLVGITNKGNYDAQTPYVKGNFVYYNGSTWLLKAATATGIEPNENNSATWQYLAKGFNVLPFEGATASTDGTGGTVPQPLAGDQDKFLKANGSWANVPNPSTMTGATSSDAGAGGLVPQPLAGDEDKVLQGNGTFGKKLQMDVVVQNNQYGYINGSNQFVPFKSQADIDAAVSAAMVGTATAADVLSGKTFTNSSNSGVSGSMPQRSNGQAATGSGIDGTGPWVYMPYGYYPEYSGNAGNSYVYMTAAQAVAACPKEERTVTAGTSAASITPNSGKLISKVTYNPTPSQEKSTTSSRSAQTITPDSGKLLSKVSIAKYPDASGTFTTSTNSSAVDMGTTNNYRYVNTTGVYTAGYNAGKNISFTRIGMYDISNTANGETAASKLVAGYYYIIAVARSNNQDTSMTNNANFTNGPLKYSGGSLTLTASYGEQKSRNGSCYAFSSVYIVYSNTKPNLLAGGILSICIYRINIG